MQIALVITVTIATLLSSSNAYPLHQMDQAFHNAMGKWLQALKQSFPNPELDYQPNHDEWSYFHETSPFFYPKSCYFTQ